MNLTSGRLLEAMEPGQVYQAADLAERLSATALEVRGALCVLIEDGLVRMCSQSSRILSFERLPAGSGSPARDDSAATTMATPPVTRNLRGSLRGYEASLSSVRNLAMLSRGAPDDGQRSDRRATVAR